MNLRTCEPNSHVSHIQSAYLPQRIACDGSSGTCLSASPRVPVFRTFESGNGLDLNGLDDLMFLNFQDSH